MWIVDSRLYEMQETGQALISVGFALMYPKGDKGSPLGLRTPWNCRM